MARSDLIVELVKAGVSGDQASVRETAEAIAAEERAKKHSGVADRIAKVLTSAARPEMGGQARHGGVRVRDGSGGIQRREPYRPLAELFLDRATRDACLELIEEQHRADVLRAHGIEPRHRLLLVGPPGNGKTSLAECLAYELALPLFVVRYDAVVTSYLGETAQRLRRLFDFVRTEPCVLFFDAVVHPGPGGCGRRGIVAGRPVVRRCRAYRAHPCVCRTGTAGAGGVCGQFLSGTQTLEFSWPHQLIGAVAGLVGALARGVVRGVVGKRARRPGHSRHDVRCL